jgi:hypothetical protein
MAMNIGQALRRLGILKGRVAQWEQRARQSNVVGEDEKPTYQYQECVDERQKYLDELISLGAKVAEANARNTITYKDKEITLSEAIRRLDNLKGEIAWVKSIPALSHTEVTTQRDKREWDEKERTHVYREVPYTQKCTLNERAKERRLDQLQEDFDELNSLVDGANNSISVE